MTYRGLLTATSVLSVVFLASLMHGGDDPVAPAQPVRAAMGPLKKAQQSGVMQKRQSVTAIAADSALIVPKSYVSAADFSLATLSPPSDEEIVLPLTKEKAMASSAGISGGDAVKVASSESGSSNVMGALALPADVLSAAFAPATAPVTDVAAVPTPVLGSDQNTLSPIHRVPTLTSVPAVPEPEFHALLLAGLGLLGAVKGVRRVLKSRRK